MDKSEIDFHRSLCVSMKNVLVNLIHENSDLLGLADQIKKNTRRRIENIHPDIVSSQNLLDTLFVARSKLEDKSEIDNMITELKRQLFLWKELMDEEKGELKNEKMLDDYIKRTINNAKEGYKINNEMLAILTMLESGKYSGEQIKFMSDKFFALNEQIKKCANNIDEAETFLKKLNEEIISETERDQFFLRKIKAYEKDILSKLPNIQTSAAA